MSKTRNVFLHQIIKNSLVTYLSYKWSKNNLYLKKRSKLSNNQSNTGNKEKSFKKLNKKHSIINLENDVFIFDSKTNTFTQLDLGECFRNSLYYKTMDPFAENCNNDLTDINADYVPTISFDECDKLQNVFNKEFVMDKWSNEEAYTDTLDIFIEKGLNKNFKLKAFTQEKNTSSGNNICSSSVGYYAITNIDRKNISSSHKKKRIRHSNRYDIVGIQKEYSETKKYYHKSLQVSLSSSSSHLANNNSKKNAYEIMLDKSQTSDKGIQCVNFTTELKSKKDRKISKIKLIKKKNKIERSYAKFYTLNEKQSSINTDSTRESLVSEKKSKVKQIPSLPLSSLNDNENKNDCIEEKNSFGVNCNLPVLYSDITYDNMCGLQKTSNEIIVQEETKETSTKFNEIQKQSNTQLFNNEQAKCICDILNNLKEKIKNQTEEQNKNLDYIMEELGKQATELKEIRETISRRKRKKDEKKLISKNCCSAEPHSICNYKLKEEKIMENTATKEINRDYPINQEPEIIELFGNDKKQKYGRFSNCNLFKKESWKSIWNLGDAKTFFVMERLKKSPKVNLQENSKIVPHKNNLETTNAENNLDLHDPKEIRSKPWLPNFLNPRKLLKSKQRIC